MKCFVIRDDRGLFLRHRSLEWIDSRQLATHYRSMGDLPIWFDDPIGGRVHLELSQDQQAAWYHTGTEHGAQIIARVVEVLP